MVAPRAGAWIETCGAKISCAEHMSPLAQGRGLKRDPAYHYRWRGRSPLAQGRGLKQKEYAMVLGEEASPLAQGRGLKLGKYLIKCILCYVAPRAGAWIETSYQDALMKRLESPLAQGRGLKQKVFELVFIMILRRPSRRGVD